jgi:hypothetical protein
MPRISGSPKSGLRAKISRAKCIPSMLQNAVSKNRNRASFYKPCCTSFINHIPQSKPRTPSSRIIIHSQPPLIQDPSPQMPNTPMAKPTPLTPHLTNSIHCCSRARLSTSSPLTSSTFSSTTPCFKRFSIAKFKLPLAAATRPVQSRYGCLMRAGLRANAASSDTLASEESVRMCRVARRVVCARV